MRKHSSLLLLTSVAAFAAVFFLHLDRAERGTTATAGLQLSVGAPKAEARRAIRAIGRAVGGAVRAVARTVTTVTRAATHAVGGVAKGIASAAKSVGKAVGSVARTVGQGLAKGVQTIGKGVAQVAKGVAKVAQGAVKVVGSVAKGAVQFTGGVLKGAGSLLKGDLKGAVSAVKAGASAAASTVVTGVKAGVKDVVSGVKDVAAGTLKVATGALQVALPFVDVDKILAKIKEVIAGLLQKICSGLLDKMGGVLEKIVGVISPELKDAIATVRSLLEAGQQILAAIQNPADFLHKGREWAIDKLTELAMKVFQPPLEKLVGALTGAGMKLLKHLITTPLTGMVTSAIASVTLGIGALAAPVIKMGIDKLIDWGIDQIKGALAKLAMAIPFVQKFLHDKVVAPLVNTLFDKIIVMIQKKWPSVGQYTTTTAQQAAGEHGKTLVPVGKLRDFLAKADNILAMVQNPRQALQTVFDNLDPIGKVTASIDQVAARILPTSAPSQVAIAQLRAAGQQVKTVLGELSALLKQGATALDKVTKFAPQLKNLSTLLTNAAASVDRLPAQSKSAAQAVIAQLKAQLSPALASLGDVGAFVDKLKASAK